MATADGQTRRRPVAIAPAATAGPPTEALAADGASFQTLMPYSCRACAKRKIKCDKTTPSCSSCRKAKVDCWYQAPAPRIRKRKLSDDIFERLDRYERILKENGLLDAAVSSSEARLASQDSVNLYWNESETATTGKLLTGQGRSRYIENNLWRNLAADEVQRLSDEEGEEDQATGTLLSSSLSDPLTGAFLTVTPLESLLQYHPSEADSILLWDTHRENVEPICKILHIPSAASMVKKASKRPEMTSLTEECLLFAIYHFAVFSMTNEESEKKLGQSRDALLQRYHLATRQALVKASFLKTTDMSVLQALILFLIPCRHSYDPHTYWILTGVAVRIGQRMGLHRDGGKMGLPPFDVQMRRRLFYQILPLDGNASQMSGTSIPIVPGAWDTQQPLNINDDQIWPGMTESPEEQNAATEMIFCLSRSWIGRSLVLAGRSANGGHVKDYQEAEIAIKDAENEVEEKYIRYCDIINPLHFLTIGLARSGISYMRLKLRLGKIRNNTATDAERRDMFQLAQKILDTDTVANSHPDLKRFGWYVRRFFLWGTWDSLIFIVTSLWRRTDLLSPAETNVAWNKLEQVLHNHAELLSSKRTLHVAFGRLTLKAWDANSPSSSVPEPEYIASLRSLQKAKAPRRLAAPDIGAETAHATSDTTQSIMLSTPGDLNAFLAGVSDADLWMSNDFDIQAAEWTFWDQLIQADHQVQHIQQQEQ
ncbi:hypothetical protein BR93DRAFT_932042 [Coniochaeta sp. PMI_546]|nr:hypothetical protein BR93DRAFT_932042 [Coniochaeta sp. PMI_546]